MDLQKLVRERHWLAWQMRNYEDKYGLRSSDFYAAMESDQLAAFDDADHPAFQAFVEWHGLYKVWLKREQRYSAPVHRPVVPA